MYKSTSEVSWRAKQVDRKKVGAAAGETGFAA
jgi:hypothetical protein